MNNPYIDDSGKESTTGSDFSNQSAISNEVQPPLTRSLMSFESPGRSKAALQIAMQFDPLSQVMAGDEALQQLRQTPSYDSLLQDPNGGTTSGNVSPCVYSTSPKIRRQPSPREMSRERTSPRSSLSREQALAAARNSPSSARSRRPSKLHSYGSDTGPISAQLHPQPRPFSPSQHHSKVSPSGSVQSLFATIGYESDYGMGGFQSDSDATSTHSSLLDLPHGEDFNDDLQPPLVPTPADLDNMHFDFDLRNF